MQVKNQNFMCNDFRMNTIYSAQNGSESRFRVKCFFFMVDLCYILWSVLLHHLICIALVFLNTI